MKVINLPTAMTAWSDKMTAAGKSIALVPTMGYFHKGHLELMRAATSMVDRVVVSLFVNPTQFGPAEDFSRYPRDIKRDAAMAEQEGVSILFVPTAEKMYRDDFQTEVSVGRLTDTLCGKNRPGHFAGVATVVAKLFNIIKPQIGIFGEKDFQQLAVIRRMVKDLNWNIKIIGHPIVREADGLAMSSRNTCLTSEERQSALCLYRAIRYAKKLVRTGLIDTDPIISGVKQLLQAERNIKLEYVSIVDQDTLDHKTTIDHKAVLALAIKIGRTRLIDNCRLFTEEQETSLC